MKRFAWSWIAVAAVALATPATAQQYYAPENGMRFRGGIFSPNAEGDYWDEKFFGFTGSPDDFEDFTIGVEYIRTLNPFVDLVVGGSYYEALEDQAYRDFEDSDGLSIVHTTAVENSNFEVGVRFRLAPLHSPVIPYVGGGGSVVMWRLTEHGDFIDFTPPETIFFDDFQDDGVALGYFLMAGIEVPVGPYFGIFAEGRWRDASDELSGEFENFGDLDLSGTEITGGVIWRF
jgi:opacity protein-like surface antigen